MLAVISGHLTAEADENPENFSHGGWRPARDLKPETYKKNLLNWTM